MHTNAGSVNMDITETKTLQGNLQVNAVTDLGSVNVGLVVMMVLEQKLFLRPT